MTDFRTHLRTSDVNGNTACLNCGARFKYHIGLECPPQVEMSAPPLAPIESALARQEGGGHYKDLKIQPVEYIHANNIGFLEGSVIKYVTRWRGKNGIEDLKKARHFIDLLIELEAKHAS